MLVVSHVSKDYASPQGPIPILNDVTLALDRGEAAAIMGPSGSGKSTLLAIAGGLEAPSLGSVLVDNVNPYTLDEREAARFRGETIGFVFQEHALLPQLTVLENVLAPTLVDTLGRARANLDRARQLLVQVGLEHRLTHRPGQLSGGERQRAALARALIRRPAVLLCDEPTGNLDPRNAELVADLLVELHRTSGTTLALVTHSETLAARFPRRFTLRDGRLVQA